MYTGDKERDELAGDRFGVDGTPVDSGVVEPDVLQLKVPVPDERSYDAEPRVIDHSALVVRQRYRVLIEPRHL